MSDHTTRPRPPSTLVGRDHERRALADFLQSATRSGGVQLVMGDGGMGKSVLLDAATDFAIESCGARVLRASGVEFEAELGYACLNQLLLPVADALDELPAAQGAALRGALGLPSAETPGLLALATAALALLQVLSRDAPLVLVVDDIQWVDRASLHLLSVVARRLGESPIGMLLAQRSGHETFFDRGAIPLLELTPLTDADARALVEAHHPRLHSSVRRRIIDDAGGNPLALIELPRGLTSAQESAVDLLPTTLPLGIRLNRLFSDRVAALPDPSRRLLLLAALHYGDSSELMRIVAGSSADLEPAEAAGLVLVDSGTRSLQFIHPLVRAAVVELASAPQRRAAHRRLADLASNPQIRTLHLAESVVGTDDAVAHQLDGVADSALASGDAARAVEILLRAADLSAVGADRARRLAGAAYLAANVTGALEGSSGLLERARTADPDAVSTLQVATAAAAHLLNSDGGVDTAHRMLTSALAALPPDRADPRLVQDAVHTLMLVCAFGGREELWRSFSDAAARWTSQLSPAVRIALVTFADPARSSPELLAELDDLVSSVDEAENPVHALDVGLAGHYVDREPAAALDRVVQSGRSGGPIALAAQALVMRAMTAFHEGRWVDAATLADEGIALCVEHGYRLLEWGAQNPRMLLAAVRGDDEYLERARERMHQWALPRQMLAVRTFTANVDALAALSAGRYDEAYGTYASILQPGQATRYGQVAMWNVLDVVEAALGSGHEAEARRHAEMAAATLAPISARLRFQAAAAMALVTTGPDYAAEFDRVVDDPESARWPFPLARLELAYGERLRRDRVMRGARPHLERAAAVFAELDARLWVDRAERALSATGRSRTSAGDTARAAPTPQELAVAELAASGLSNRQIGERLFLSPRTVGAHLYRVFPKLGVTSRAALRDALAQYRGGTVTSFD